MRPISRRAVLSGAVCFCCLPTLARRASAAPTPAETAEVAPGIHVRRGLLADASPGNADAIANLAFIVGRESVAVFDPGGSLADGEGLRLGIRAVTKLPIRWVVLSHVHPDHVFGAAAFLPEKPVFAGHAGLPDLLAARGEFYRQGLDRILGAGPPVVPTLLVKDHAEIDLGNRIVVLTAHKAAHTSADLSALDRQTGTLLTGDLLFVDRVPSLDGDLRGWLAALAALRKTGVRRAVPGHGPVSVEWPAAGVPLERYLRLLLEETRAAVAKGVPVEKAATTVAVSERENWQLFDAYNGRNVIEACRKLEWE